MTQSSSDNTLLNGQTDAQPPSQHAQMTDEVENNGGNVNGKPRSESDHQDPERNGNIGGEKAEGGPPSPVGFWHSSLNQVRKTVILLWARTTLILFVFILAILSLYWAVLFKVSNNMSSLTVDVVDFDGNVPPYESVVPVVGPFVTKMTTMEVESPNPMHLGYRNRAPRFFDNDPLAVRRHVYNEGAWAGIVVNANATALLRSAVETGNASYSPLGAVQIIYNEARDETTYDNYIIPMLQELQTNIASAFGEMWSGQCLTNNTLSRETLSRAPQAISPAIGFSIYNLRPFNPPATTPSVTIGLIYLIIIAFFSFSFFLPIHMKLITPKRHPPLHFYQLIIWRWLTTVVAYLFLSLAYSLVSLAFQIPFHAPSAAPDAVANPANAYGNGTFAVYWMLNFVGMSALGLPCENVAMIVGAPWFSLWLIFWVITNVCTSFYSITLSPRFFFWGYAWPLHHIVYGSRTLLFDTKSNIGENFGVLFAWTAISTALFPFCCLFMRWKSDRGKAKEQGKPEPRLRDILR